MYSGAGADATKSARATEFTIANNKNTHPTLPQLFEHPVPSLSR
ncbi:10217_t:CDS:1, partial [Paraglomus brasilianum]